VATLTVEVMRHDAPGQPRRPWKVLASDGTGTLELVFFRPDRLRTLPVGSRVIVSGKVEGGYGRLSMPHPDHVVAEADAGRIPPVEPVWGLTAGLHAWQMRWHDPTLVARHGWPGFSAALRMLHAPTELPGDAARERVAYDELLAHQVALAWTRARQRHRPGRSVTGDGALRDQALARFGHQPTPSQVKALAEIDADLAAPRRMMRLLQGDVGSASTTAPCPVFHRCRSGC
jgi:ATP-dependent DNA helicase RecG